MKKKEFKFVKLQIEAVHIRIKLMILEYIIVEMISTLNYNTGDDIHYMKAMLK